MTIEPGSLLADRYRVVRVLGRGGMGLVAEARNVVTDKRVAVKALHEEVARDPEMSARLLREATAACRIRHPNVVDVYDVIRDGASIVLVMELLEGEPLSALLDRGRLPADELLAILIPAMHGVAEAHRQGVIHRDVHPGNIFLANELNGTRTPQVLDFGISKIGSDESPSGGLQSLTRSGMTMGTPLYMSYEQLISARDVDVRTDVYSFGVILYQGLTGQVPFDGDTFAAIAMQIVNGTPTAPRELEPSIPRDLERVVLRAMARNREDRIASVDALIAELKPFTTSEPRRTLPTPVPPSGVPELEVTARRVDTQGRTSSPFARSTPPSEALEPARRKALVLGMAAGGALALVGALMLLPAKKSSSAPETAHAAAVPSLPAPLPVEPALAAEPDAGALLPKGVETPADVAVPSKSEVVPPRRRVKPAASTPAAPVEDKGPAFRAGRARREDF